MVSESQYHTLFRAKKPTLQQGICLKHIIQLKAIPTLILVGSKTVRTGHEWLLVYRSSLHWTRKEDTV